MVMLNDDTLCLTTALPAPVVNGTWHANTTSTSWLALCEDELRSQMWVFAGFDEEEDVLDSGEEKDELTPEQKEIARRVKKTKSGEDGWEHVITRRHKNKRRTKPKPSVLSDDDMKDLGQMDLGRMTAIQKVLAEHKSNKMQAQAQALARPTSSAR